MAKAKPEQDQIKREPVIDCTIDFLEDVPIAVVQRQPKLTTNLTTHAWHIAHDGSRSESNVISFAGEATGTSFCAQLPWSAMTS